MKVHTGTLATAITGGAAVYFALAAVNGLLIGSFRPLAAAAALVLGLGSSGLAKALFKPERETTCRYCGEAVVLDGNDDTMQEATITRAVGGSTVTELPLVQLEHTNAGNEFTYCSPQCAAADTRHTVEDGEQHAVAGRTAEPENDTDDVIEVGTRG